MDNKITVVPLKNEALTNALDDLARLRIEVFRDYPYLYDGDMSYEKNYLKNYQSDEATIIAAYSSGQIVGASTGSPMRDHAKEFGRPFVERGYDLDDIFYFGESVLLKSYRGQGIGHQFFDYREQHASRLKKKYITFCGVVRAQDHALKPNAYRPLDAFWHKRGYEPLVGVLASFSWKDLDQANETSKQLQFWFKSL